MINNFIDIFIESAPWLLLGLLVAGLMKAFLPEDFLTRHLSKTGWLTTVKAALIGAPLPLCSCGVIPAAVSLRRGGASKAATTSFLISTPETGVDSISISYALLGPFMAIIRPIAAVSSAVTAGLLVGPDKPDNTRTTQNKTSCCSTKKPKNEQSNCCSNNTDTSMSIKKRIRLGLQFTFIDLIRDIALWLVIGLGFAAIIRTYVPSDLLSQWGDSFFAFFIMAAVGVPMYICATTSTPIAAGLLFSGVSPGAVLVFMLVGPATNIATIGLVKKELGGRALTAYLSGVVGIGFLFGFITNKLAQMFNINISAQVEHTHELLPGLVSYSASTLLAVLLVYALYSALKVEKQNRAELQ